MINTLINKLKIESAYSINSHIYRFRQLPIFKDLITEKAYSSKVIKNIFRIISIIFDSIKAILFRLIYFAIVLGISLLINEKNILPTFINTYVIFTIIGMFLNNDLLRVDINKYLCVLLFNMDAKHYAKSSLLENLVINFILNVLSMLIIHVPGMNIEIILLLIIFNSLARIIAEALEIRYYKKHSLLFTDKSINYFFLLILVLVLLPYINIYVSLEILCVLTIIFMVLACFSYLYISNIKDFHLMYKRLNTAKTIISEDEAASYRRQAVIDIKDKDKLIDNKKIIGKSGYDLFNTIFFERHKAILYRSAKYYTIAEAVVIAVIIGIVIFTKNNDYLSDFLLNRLGFMVLIMYFINRGSIVTEAMFFNCDHAMLTYNFYRESKVILGLFKRRLLTIIKINLLPAIVLALGVELLLFLGKGIALINFITIPLFIIFLSIFFSVHYLVLYYLLQPFNKDLQVKSYTYSIVTFITYIVCYSLNDLKASSLIFSMLGLVFTIIYIIIALILVYKYAPKRFKLKD